MTHKRFIVPLLAGAVVVALAAGCGGGGGSSSSNSVGGKITIAGNLLKNSDVRLGSTKKGGEDRKGKTDAQGKYSFEGAPAGDYLVSFGFRLNNGTCAVVHPVKVKGNGQQIEDIAIEESDLKSGISLSSAGDIIKCQ